MAGLDRDFDALWDYSDPAGTEAKFRERLARLEAGEAGESGAVDRGISLELRTQIARTLGLQQRFDESLGELDAVDAAIGAALDADPGDRGARVARVRARLERGRALNSSKRAGEAVPVFEEAWDLARDLEAHGYAVDAAHMLGIACPGDEGIAWNEKAMAYAEETGAEEAMRWLGPLYNNTGWAYDERGEHEKAMALFVKCRDWNAARDRIRPTGIARWSIAKMQRKLGRLEEALAEQEALAAENAERGQPDGYVFEESAECLLALDRADEARPHFAAAYEALKDDQWLRRDEADRLARLAELGGVEPEGSVNPRRSS